MALLYIFRAILKVENEEKVCADHRGIKQVSAFLFFFLLELPHWVRYCFKIYIINEGVKMENGDLLWQPLKREKAVRRRRRRRRKIFVTVRFFFFFFLSRLY